MAKIIFSAYSQKRRNEHQIRISRRKLLHISISVGYESGDQVDAFDEKKSKVKISKITRKKLHWSGTAHDRLCRFLEGSFRC
jgi:hypothetical protein